MTSIGLDSLGLIRILLLTDGLGGLFVYFSNVLGRLIDSC